MADEQVDWNQYAHDPCVRMMLRAGTPMTRENYIGVKYGSPGTEDYPQEWTDEHEDSLPAPLQRS